MKRLAIPSDKPYTRQPRTGTCAVRGCMRSVYARGWCNAHYSRWRLHGDPGPARILHDRSPEARAERFWALVAKRKSDECWLWQGAIVRGGYGSFTDYIEPAHIRIQKRAHQVAFELEHGWHPKRGSGQQIRHLCGNPACVNVAHLAAGTALENAEDRRRHGGSGYTLTYEQAQEIRARLAAGAVGSWLAIEYNVSPMTISRIKNGTRHKPR